MQFCMDLGWEGVTLLILMANPSCKVADAFLTNNDLYVILDDLFQFIPTTLTLDSGVTRPPPLLSEADLLSCMDKVMNV